MTVIRTCQISDWVPMRRRTKCSPVGIGRIPCVVPVGTFTAFSTADNYSSSLAGDQPARGRPESPVLNADVETGTRERRESQVDPLSHKCEDCGKGFRHLRALVRHKVSKHPGKKRELSCPFL